MMRSISTTAFASVFLLSSTVLAQDAAAPAPAAPAPAPAEPAPKERIQLDKSPSADAPVLEELPVEVLPDKVEEPEPPPPEPTPVAPVVDNTPPPEPEPAKAKLLPAPTLPRILVLELVDKGAGADITAALSEAMAAQALKSHPGEVVTTQQLRLLMRAQATQQSLGCESFECSMSLGELTEAEKVLSGSVAKVGQDVVITLRMAETVGDDFKTVQRKVPLHQDLYFYATRQLTSLLLTGRSVETRVPVYIGSSIDGASIIVDGQGMGVAPKTLSLDPGFHEIRVLQEGYVAWRTQVEVEDATPLEVYAILVEEGVTLWPAAAVSAGLGVVTLAGAGVLFAYAFNAYDAERLPIPVEVGGYAADNSYVGLDPATKSDLRERQRAVQVFYFSSVGTAVVGTILVGVGGALLLADFVE